METAWVCANWKKVSFKPTDSRGVPGTSKSNAVP